MSRRIRKAERILRDLPRDADMGEFLRAAGEMADETDTYPVDDQIVDLEKLGDDEYNDILDSHEDLEKALDRWTGIIKRFGEGE